MSNNWRPNRFGIETHLTACHKIAEELGLDPKKVSSTVRAFFSFRGIKNFIKPKHIVQIRSFGTFKANWKGHYLNKRRKRLQRITERFKKRKYRRKKVSNKFV